MVWSVVICDAQAPLTHLAGSRILATTTFRSSTARTRPSAAAVRRERCGMAWTSCRRRTVARIGSSMLGMSGRPMLHEETTSCDFMVLEAEDFASVSAWLQVVPLEAAIRRVTSSVALRVARVASRRSRSLNSRPCCRQRLRAIECSLLADESYISGRTPGAVVK